MFAQKVPLPTPKPPRVTASRRSRPQTMTAATHLTPSPNISSAPSLFDTTAFRSPTRDERHEAGGNDARSLRQISAPVTQPPVEVHSKCTCGDTCADCQSGSLGQDMPQSAWRLGQDVHLRRAAVPLRQTFGSPRVQDVSGSTRSALEANLQSGSYRQLTANRTGASHGSPPTGLNIDVARSAPEPVRRLARNGDGRALPSPVQRVMSSRFGYDFSGVRIHDDDSAAAATRSVGAIAYTLGKDIAFAPGAFQPATPAGLFLIAHELSHVVQQDGVPVSPETIIVGDKASPREREANQAATSVTRGLTVTLQRGSLGAPTAQLQAFFLSEEPAGGCGLCYGIPANAGRAAHALIQTEFEILYPLGLIELPLVDTNDENGRLDLAVAVPGGFEIGEIKPANEQGYSDGITQIARYVGLIASRYPGRTVKPLTKLLPPVIFPTLSSDCPVQMLFVNPPIGGVYGYFCRPSFAELMRRGCSCPAPRRRQKEEESEKKEKEKKPEKQKETIPESAPSMANQILEFVQRVIAGGVNVEQAVSDFLKANDEIVRNIERVVALIVAGTILSDIASGGAAIAKDPLVLSILAAMLRQARLLAVAAAL
jgi:hypothetical protein